MVKLNNKEGIEKYEHETQQVRNMKEIYANYYETYEKFGNFKLMKTVDRCLKKELHEAKMADIAKANAICQEQTNKILMDIVMNQKADSMLVDST